MSAEPKVNTLADCRQRLAKLHAKRNAARVDNHKQVLNEDARMHLPKNYESRQKQAAWLLADKERRDAASAAGKDYNRQRMLEVSAVEAEQQAAKQQKRKNADVGFSTFEMASKRQYDRLVRAMPSKDMEHYAEERVRYGDAAFYSRSNVIVHGMHTDRPQAIERMVQDLDAQVAKREKYSRRRTHNDDADIDYINERNARFNKKLEKFYGEYTAEIKQNLERGTAV